MQIIFLLTLLLPLWCNFLSINCLPSLSCLKDLLPTNPIIVEAGGHNGSDTHYLAKLWPQSSIHTFEPVPHLFQQLEANTRQIVGVKRYNYALSQTNGSSIFHVSSGSSDGASSSLLAPKLHLRDYPAIVFPEAITVKTVTLDSWAEENNIDHVDFMWLDMQGAEPAMLQASPKILKTVKAVLTEVSYVELYEGTMLYKDFKVWMREQGFIVVQEQPVTASWGDALFIRIEQ